VKPTEVLKKIIRIGLVLIAVMVIPGRAAPAQETQAAIDARALLSFNDRIQSYIKIHRQAEGKLGHLTAAHSGREIVKYQQEMAEHIRRLRRKANEGNLFAPQIRAYFIRALDSAYLTNPDGVSASLACVSLRAERKLKPNDVYPETWDYNIMPPTLLLHIPRLPAELEYRIVNKDLIVRDIDANMIVDVMRGVMVTAITSVPEGAQCDD
jgi:hypothetical protein